MAAISSIELLGTKIPLREGYDLSFGTLEYFSTLLVRVEAGGAQGLGEATYLPGYGSETFRNGLDAARKVCPALIGQDLASAMEEVHDHKVPTFTHSALTTTLETIDTEVSEISVPLVATLSRDSPLEEALTRLDEGYSEFKFKIGFDPEDDARQVSEVLDVVGDGVLRVDANRGYGREEAEEFLSSFSPRELALLEQPLDEGDGEGHRELREFGTPIMLDEEIRSVRDIERVAREGSADLVKLKLFKTGSPRDLLDAADRAVERGLGVVVGNGVQTGLGCLHEARVWSRMENAGLAGEMNGFLKMESSVLRNPPEKNEGRLVWSGGPPVFREDLDRFVVERAVFEAG